MSSKNLIACKNCSTLFSKDSVCPICLTNNFTTKYWSGMAIIVNSRSLIGKKMNISRPGNYALKVRS